MAEITLEDAVKRYGAIDFRTKVWPQQKEWLEVLSLPSELLLPTWKIASTAMPVRHIYCNKDITHGILQGIYNIKEAGLQEELKTFDGCFNIRFVRGTTNEPSTHSYGLALDLNAVENPLGGPIALSSGFISCWKSAGFSWGGDFKRVDGMHFSWAWE